MGEPTTDSAYAEFCTNMAAILAANFDTEVPETTKRSEGGLRPQHGIVLGCMVDSVYLAALAQQLIHLPDVWAPYLPDSLHCTFAAVDHDGAQVSQRALGQFDGLRELVANAAKLTDFDATLTEPALLVSGDTIILATVPSPELFAGRELLVADTPAFQAAGVRRSWGCHFTLARARRSLDPGEANATNGLLASFAEGMPTVLQVNELLAAVFTVADERFAFQEKHVVSIGG